jgi:hypothetical protein
MTALPLSSYRRRGQFPTPLGWSDHRTRTAALNGWLAREEVVAIGAAAPTDPAVLGLPDRETLVRALFQRFTTTLEGALDSQLELGEHDTAPYAAVRAAYRRAAAHRPADWRALQREAGDPVVVELTRRQHSRIASRVGITAAEVTAVATEVAQVDTTALVLSLGLSPRARRRRVQRVLARRAG